MQYHNKKLFSQIVEKEKGKKVVFTTCEMGKKFWKRFSQLVKGYRKKQFLIMWREIA
jgi:hypothetical protein